MKNSKKKSRKKILCMVSAALLLTASLPMEQVLAKEEDVSQVITIQSVSDLEEVASKCTLDDWSADKVIELQADISLEGIDFEPFQVFAGSFHGNGHSISGFQYTGSGYADGFFRYITPQGIVQDLTLTGKVVSENEENCTGGICGINAGWILNCTFTGSIEGKSETGAIAGENENTGTISSCNAYGRVTGYDRAGGIVGANYGAVRNCINKAGINSDSSWLEAEDGEGLSWLLEDAKEKKLVSGTDIGGIAGISKGILINCTNQGVVGYEHSGYNIGGIVGRQSGQVVFCTNEGEVYGRKDVGGIVGQMEPYISVEEAASVSEAVQKLHDQIEAFLEDAGATQDLVSEDFDVLLEHSDTAIDNADTIVDGAEDFVNENVEAVNEAASRLDYLMEQLPYVMEDAKQAVAGMNDAAGDLGKVADALDISGKVEDTEYTETDHARLSLVSGVGGMVYADKAAPAEGEVVTITLTPDSGYKISDIRVTDADKNTLELVSADDGTTVDSYAYSFVMPSSNVVVKAEFAYDMDNSGQDQTGGSGTVRVYQSEMGETDPDGSPDDTQPDDTKPTYKVSVTNNGVSDSEIEAKEGAVLVVSVNPSSGSQAQITITADGSPVEYTSTLNGRAYQFTMPAADAAVAVTFSKAQVIVESNAGGKADYTVSDNVVTLSVRPDSGYQVEGIPSASYQNGTEAIPVSKKNASAEVYEFTIDTAKGNAEVYIIFKPSTNEQAVEQSGNNLSENVALLQQQMQKISNTMEQINQFVDGRTFDQIKQEGGEAKLISMLLDLAQQLSDAGTTIGYVLSDLTTIANIMTPYMKEALEEAGVEMDLVIADLEEAFTNLDMAFGRIRSTMIYLNGKFDIQFAPLGDEVEESIQKLFEQLDAISECAAKIGQDLDVHSDILEGDLQNINDQINLIFQLFAEKIEDAEDLYYEEDGYEDISEEDIESSTQGKAERCVNKGIVRGDVNIGGITGSMAIDEEDPEGNAAGSVQRSLGSRYLTRCVIADCENTGQITAKKDGAGGIVGYMNLGIVIGSKALGSVESTEGEYVGGISGESLALIRNCWVLATLNGRQYVGGVAGLGTKIQNCHVMAHINEDAIHKGAVAGFVATKEDERTAYQTDITDNDFVGSSLQGIDGASYAGIAEPITYEQLIEREDVPIQYRHLQVTFLAEKKIVAVEEVKYGTPLASIELPAVPEKEGKYGKWQDISSLVMEGNLTLEAQYYDSITTLQSEEMAEKPCAYLDGIFSDDMRLHAVMEKHTGTETKKLTDKYKAESVTYEVRLENAQMGAEEVSKLRLYNPYASVEKVLENKEGKWQEVTYKEYGQYLQVELNGTQSAYCIVAKNNQRIVIFGILAAAVVLLAIGIVRKRKKLFKQRINT